MSITCIYTCRLPIISQCGLNLRLLESMGMEMDEAHGKIDNSANRLEEYLRQATGTN